MLSDNISQWPPTLHYSAEFEAEERRADRIERMYGRPNDDGLQIRRRPRRIVVRRPNNPRANRPDNAAT